MTCSPDILAAVAPAAWIGMAIGLSLIALSCRRDA